MNKTILECVVGSTLHGTSVDDGLEDLDLMSVVVEDFQGFVGFRSERTMLESMTGYTSISFTHQPNVWTERTKPEGVRSEAGDVDHVRYGLKKYLGLALKCNPTVLLPLFVPNGMLRTCTAYGYGLRDLAPAIVHKGAHSTFKGYMLQQLERMLGKSSKHKVTRPELIAKYWYDTKYAGHVIRLGLQGVELLETGMLSLPMTEESRRLVVDVRTGKYELAQVEDTARALLIDLDEAYATSPLPEKPKYEMIETWMLQTYKDHWYA